MSKAKEPEYLSVEKLLSSDNYVIPIYQRDYAWGEAEITQLIQDVVDYYIKKDDTGADKLYYIGTLIVYERNNNGKIVYETIDGQQRLTTLIILLNAIRHKYLDKCLDLNMSWYQEVNLSFDSRKVSSHTLRELFKDGELCTNEYNSAIKNGYECAAKALERILNENKFSPDKLSEFFNYLFEKVTVLRVIVPEDTDLNHYFEIMNSRGEQLEKHEILKAQCLEALENENFRYAFNLIWEACSNMRKYVQYGFHNDQKEGCKSQRESIFGEDWNSLVDENDVYQRLQPQVGTNPNGGTTTNPNGGIKMKKLLEEVEKGSTSADSADKVDSDRPERFGTIINFPNFLLHILRIQEGKEVPLDDKRLLKSFKEYLFDMEPEDKKREAVKKFGYNLLKGKFLFDKYVIKREIIQDTDRWSLKWLQHEKDQVSYVNTFGKDEETNEGTNREVLMLLSMFHVSNPSLVYKHWLYAVLKHVFENYASPDVENFVTNYKNYLENLAKAFLYDHFLAKEPKDYFGIIYTNGGEPQNQDTDINGEKLDQGVNVENFIFNYLDYLLWKNFTTREKEYFKIKKEKPLGDEKLLEDDRRVKDFEYSHRSSVEHYYPQHSIDSKELQGGDKRWLDSFGNLCLISSSKNSRLSNHMPIAKKDYYKSSQTIDSIKQRIMMEYDDWGVNEIKEHGEKMKELLLSAGKSTKKHNKE